MLNALVELVGPFFDKTHMATRISEVVRTSDWTNSVLIYDVSYATEDLSTLLLQVPKQALPRTIILVGPGVNAAQSQALIGKVGAILTKDSDVDEIALVARIVRSGLVLLPSDIALPLQASSIAGPAKKAATAFSLTGREAEVLAALAHGWSNKIIGRKLGINDTTVRVHIRALLRKMGVHNRTQAALMMARLGEAVAGAGLLEPGVQSASASDDVPGLADDEGETGPEKMG